MKTLLTAAIVAMLAFALVACGGGDDQTTGSGATGAETTESTAAAPESDDSGGNEKQTGDDSGGASNGEDSSSSGGNSSAGEGSAAFRTPGGDNSIQNYGEEADTEEREAAEANLAAYLDARASGDWATSCEYLAEAAAKPLEQLAKSSPQLKGKGCAGVIAAFSAQLPSSSRANPLVEGVASLRVEGDRAFALFHGPKGTDYFMPMVEEGGEWRVGALAASEFP